MNPIAPITRIIVHHSASPIETTLGDIRKWHVEENGWEDVGYHYVVGQLGMIQPARSTSYMGAHAKGSNFDSIGVCLVGNNTEERNRWTREQVWALQRLWESARIIWPGIEIYGHRDVSSGTECPGVDVRYLVNGPRYGNERLRT